MPLLIIGANGQQGRAVCDAALSSGLSVRDLVRRADAVRGAARPIVAGQPSSEQPTPADFTDGVLQISLDALKVAARASMAPSP